MEKFTLFSRPGHKLGLFCFIHLLLSLSGVYANDKIVAPAMADCGISATVSAQSCFNFGTSNASDDKITFTLTVSSTGNVGGFVSVFDGATNLGGQGLNTPKEYVKQFFISELPKTLTIKAGDGSACEITVTINPIATCSPVCIWDPSNINPPYASSTINRDCKGTADESDDTVSGVFSVSGTPAGYDWDLDIKLNETGTQKQLVSTQSYTVTSAPWGPISVATLKAGYPGGNGFVLWFMVTGITDCLGDVYIAFPACSTVTPCSLSLTTSSLPNGQIGTAYNQQVNTSGGSVPLNFVVSGGSLPAGLALNASTGVISGTPTAPAGTASFTITVTDSQNCSAVVPLTITTTAAPVCSLQATVTPGLCNSAINQYSITGTITATNGPPTQTITVSVGSSSTTLTLNGNMSTNYTLTGLQSDGSMNTVNVLSSESGCGTTSTTYMAPASCSATTSTCSLTATLSAQECFNNGTSATSDDKVTFTLTVSSTSNVGGFVNVFDGTTNLGGQNLGVAKTFTKQFFISELPKTLTIKAGNGSACETTVTINAMATCSPVCVWDPSNINPPYASSTINRDCKGTADESDDTVSGVFSVSGTPAGYDWDLDIKLNETGTQKQLVSTQSYTVTSVPWGPISVSALKSGYPAGNGFVLWFMVTGITDCLGDLFIAFPDCSTVTPACGLSMTPTAGICQTATNTFSSTVVVRVTNTNAGGVLTVTDGNSSQTLTVGASLSSFIGTAVFNNLTSNGSSHLVSASLAGCSSQTASYNAPASCTVCSLSLIASVLANGQIGTAYSQTISVTGSTGSLIFSSTGNLPTGLSLNTSTGVISGTPISATTTSFTVKVTDGKNCSAVAPLTITTSAAPVCSLTATATPGVCNLVTNQYTVTGTVSATNAPASQTLTISVNGITTSVILTDNDPASYTLTGLTSDGLAKTISVVSTATACGQASVTYTAPASCSVAPPRMVVVVGTPICNTLNNTYTVTGTVSFTNIPDGILTLTDNTVQAGIISITANQPSATFTLTGLSGTSPAVHQVVADINGGNGPMVASTTYATPASCTVCSLSVTTASLPNGQVGTAYSQTITTTGGTVPLIFSTLGGTLPAGLQLTANGVISGTPTTSGAASFTVEVTDGKNCSAVAPLTITTSTVPVCGLNLTVTPGLCNSATNRYTLTGQVSATNVPASGTLTVSSAAFSPAFTRTIPSGTSSGNFSFSGLVSNGQTFVVTASFSDTACTPVSQTFVAPASCSVAPICSLTLTPTAGICQTATNTFSSTVTVRIANTNAGGVLTVTDGGISQTLSVGANLSSFTGTAVFNGLPSDGSNRPVSASLSGCGSTTAAYNAPEACTVATPCSVSLTVNKGICDPITNTFSATATLTASNVQPPRSVTVDVGGQTGVFNLTATGTNTIILVVALPSDGATKTATATFAGTACAQTSTTFAAPMACTVCSMSVTPTAGPCRRTTNTFSSTVTVRITTTGSGGVLTVTDGPISQTLNVLAGVINYVGTAIFNNLPSNGSSHTVTASLPGCSSMTASYNAPTSCSMSFDLDKQARIDRGEIGGTISYTVNVVNSGPESITSLVISDTYTAGITIIPSSISTSHGSYTPGLTGGDWAIANLAPGATATLTYSASILAEGVVYNTAFTSTTSVQVCSSIPFKVCKGESFAIALTVPSGFNRYQWYLTPPGTNSRTLVADGTLASFTATLPGIYEVVVNEGLANQCAQGTCCPIIIEEIEVPSYTAVGTAPTCQGTTPQANGKITLTGLGADPTRYSYQVSPGSTFSVMQATPGSAIPVPANGVVATNLSEGTYTVRVYALINGEVACSRDFTVTLTANCTCPEEVCVPITIRKIRR